MKTDDMKTYQNALGSGVTVTYIIMFRCHWTMPAQIKRLWHVIYASEAKYEDTIKLIHKQRKIARAV